MSRKKKTANPSSVPQPVDVAPNGDEPVDPARRSAFRWLVFGLAGLVSAELAWLVSGFLKPRRRPEDTAAAVVVHAGSVDDFAVGSVTAFPQGRFYVARLGDGGFLAIARECTHLGCTVTWSAEENRFLCPCHASAFDLQGDVLSPPAPRSLDLYAVSIENRGVKVDLAQRTRRERFDPTQAVHV